MKTRPTIYPGANTSAQWFGGKFDGDEMELTAPVLCIHTTEGFGWPGYQGGGNAPHLTYWKNKGWRQHFPLNRSARALANQAGGVQTNTQGVFQLELVGTCDPRSIVRKLRGMYWPEATDSDLLPLAKFVAFLAYKWGLPVRSTVKWVSYPKNQDQKQRLSAKQWLAYSGILGHQHVPENLHGDPGNFPIDRLIALAEKELNKEKPIVPSVVSTSRKPFSFVALVWSTYTGKPASHLKLLRSWIGSKSTGKTWDTIDQAAYSKLTKKRRPTPATLAPIAEAHGHQLTNTAAGAVAAAQKAALAAYRATQEVRR